MSDDTNTAPVKKTLAEGSKNLDRVPADAATEVTASVKVSKVYSGGMLYTKGQVAAITQNPNDGFDHITPTPREFSIRVRVVGAEIGACVGAHMRVPVVFTVEARGRADNIRSWATAFTQRNAPGALS